MNTAVQRLAPAGLAVVAVFQLWVDATGSGPNYTGLDLTGFRWILLLIVVAHLALALGAELTENDVRTGLRGVAVVEIGLGLLGLFILEVAPGFIPGGLLATTVRRHVLDIGAGPGPWLFVVAGALTLAEPALNRLGSLQAVPVRVWLLLGTATLVETLLVTLRGAAWLHGTSPAGGVSLHGRELPWVGPLTLLLAILFPLAVGVFILTHQWHLLLLPAGLAWLVSLLAVIVHEFTIGSHTVHIPGINGAIAANGSLPATWLYPVVCLFAVAIIVACIAGSDGWSGE